MTSVTQRGLFKVLAVSLVLLGEIREGFTEERTVEFSLEGRHKNRTGGKGHFRQRDRSIVTKSCVCESGEYSGGLESRLSKAAGTLPPHRDVHSNPCDP